MPYSGGATVNVPSGIGTMLSGSMMKTFARRSGVQGTIAGGSQALLLGWTFVLLAAVTDTLYALSASAASDIVRDGPIRAAGRWLSGGIFLGLGLLTAFTGHRAR